MVASTSEDTGQNPGLARLKSASSSGGIKAAEVAAPIIKGKFDKPKRETKSPSLERRKEDGKLCDEDAIEAATPTQGLTQSLTQAMEVQLEDQAALDKQKHEEAVFGSDGNAVDGGWKEGLEKEKSKRRDVEDSVDMLRKEQTEQRDDICKTMHVVGKLAAASLQNAEKSDGITIFVIKKKQQNTRSYFEVLQEPTEAGGRKQKACFSSEYWTVGDCESCWTRVHQRSSGLNKRVGQERGSRGSYIQRQECLDTNDGVTHPFESQRSSQADWRW